MIGRCGARSAVDARCVCDRRRWHRGPHAGPTPWIGPTARVSWQRDESRILAQIDRNRKGLVG